MDSKKKLVEHLARKGVLASESIKRAFLDIDRACFVGEKNKPYAYEDRPLPIGYGQTISQPYTVAFMFELLQPEKGDKILDIGAGSGWTTALLKNIAGNTIGQMPNSHRNPWPCFRSTIGLAMCASWKILSNGS